MLNIKSSCVALCQMAMVLLTAWASPSPATGADSPPNIVIIISDDQSWTDYGFMGHEIIQTPHLDKLAQGGILFDRGYVPTALCRASLMTIATGRYASGHGITGNNPSQKTDKNLQKIIDRAGQSETIAELLGKQGYLSHQSGKWWEGSYQAAGFTHGMTQGFPAHKEGRHGDEGLKIGREGMAPVTDFIDLAVEQKKPFLIYYAPFMPHTPHTPPQRLLDKYRDKVDSLYVAKYYAMIEWFDETCGELLGHLDKKKVRENTLVIYVGDNGWIQDKNKRGFTFGSKQMPHDGGVRQPTIYSWPGKLKPAQRSELVNSIDMVPTICGAVGIKPPKGLPGLNLFDALAKQKPIDRDTIFGESFSHDLIDLDNPQETLMYRWVIQGQHKLILTYDGKNTYQSKMHNQMDKRPQLYDLKADPLETKNLAAQKPELLAKLVKALDDWYPVSQVSYQATFSQLSHVQDR